MRAEQSFNVVSTDIDTYLKNRVTAAVVQAGAPPKGNLTAEQIAAGETGQTAPLAPPSSGIAMSSIQNSLQKYLLPLVLVLGVSLILMARKGKGK